MVNGPMGGNMGTPPAPSQPPQVNFTTTAESRGGFNDFLKSIPPTSPPPMPPANAMPPMGGNPMANIDIFNQPMGMMGMNQPQMNPMMQPPMQPPMQQPMNMGMMQQPMMMANGGGVPPRRTEIMGQDHMLSYITPEEGGILKALGGSGRPGPMGIPSFFDAGEGMGGYGGDDSATSDNNDNNDYSDFSDYSNNTDYSAPDDDMDYTDSYSTTQDQEADFSAATEAGQDQAAANEAAAQAAAQAAKGRTNVTNVGPTSNVAYSPQFSADVAVSQGLDPSVTMSPADYSMTTQGKEAAAAQAGLEQSLADTMSLANNQVQGISRGVSRGMSPGLATAMGPSLSLDPLGLSLDVPSRGFNVGVGAPQAIGAGRGTGQGFSSYGVPTDPVVGNAPGAASTTASNIASMQDAMSKGTISGVTTGPEMNASYNTTLGSSPAPQGYEEQVGNPYSGYNIDAIEGFYNAPTTMTQLGMPPGIANSIASVVENMAKDQIAADLISGNYTAITDSNGNITGSRDSFGRVHSGMDMNAPDTGSGENDNNQVKPLNVRKPEEEEDKPPQFGSIGNAKASNLGSGNPFIVASPFTTGVGDYNPVGFDAGDLNKLIAQLTGVAAPQSMAKGGIAGYAGGGLISAVDNFLASV